VKNGIVRECIVRVQEPAFWRQSSGRSLRTFWHSSSRTSQQYAELTVWSARTNSLWTIPLQWKKMMSMLLTVLFTCLDIFWYWWVWTLPLGGHNRTSLTITMGKKAVSSLFLCRINFVKEKSDDIRNSKKKIMKKISVSTKPHETLYTDSRVMLVLPPTVASCSYNCCTDSSTSTGNYGYPLVHCTIWDSHSGDYEGGKTRGPSAAGRIVYTKKIH
jgi:hypothetical protein